MKEEIALKIEGALDGSDITVAVAGRGNQLGANDPRNIVNRLTVGGANGVQIEQSDSARNAH